MPSKTIKVPVQYRHFEIERRQISEENRTAEITFSSEAPVDRFFGKEILDHSPGSVRMERLHKKAAFLFNHNRDQQIGVVESAAIEADRRGHAVVRFSKTPLGEENFSEVLDGIKTHISVGYMVHKAVLEETGDDGDTFRITDWEPLELSLVTIPADISVGVGREIDLFTEVVIEPQTRSKKIMDDKTIVTAPAAAPAATPAAAPAPAPVDIEGVKAGARQEEQARVREILAIAEQFGMQAEGRAAVNSGHSVDQFRRSILESLKDKQHIDTSTAGIGMSEKEVARYDFSRALAAAVTGDWSKAGLELEASRETSRKTKIDPKGFFVPHDVLINRAKYAQFKREITTTAGGTGLVATETLAENFIELLRNKTVVAQLGALVLSGLVGDVSIPKQTGAATGGWIAQGGSQALSDSAYGSVALTPKTASARTQYTRQMILQSNPAIGNLVMADLMRVIAILIDLGAINGTGAANQPTGIINTPGVGSVVVGAGTTSWSHLVEFETDVAAANADLDGLAYLTNASVRGLLKTRAKDAGSGIFLVENNEINGYPLAVSNQVPASTMIFGAFSQLIMAFWGGLDVLVDPYGAAGSGAVIIHAFQSADIGVRHAGAFSVSTDID